MKREIPEWCLRGMKDPLAKQVWEQWIREGKAVLIPDAEVSRPRSPGVDFGVLVAAIVREFEFVESDLRPHERHDTRAAMERYQAAAVNVLRAVFDEAENPPATSTDTTLLECPRCGEVWPEQSNFCSRCRMPLSKEGERAVVREVIEREGSAGGLSTEEIDQFVRQMETCDPDVFAAALKVYVDATASLCKPAN